MLIVVLLAALITMLIFDEQQDESVKIENINVNSFNELSSIFDTHSYTWPPSNDEIPDIFIEHFPHDNASLPVSEKKSLFFRSLLPIILHENEAIRQERTLLTTAFDDGNIDTKEKEIINALMKKYGLNTDTNAHDSYQELILRIDTIPPALALAQAANESAWGTSRFTREANNLFGEWTYKPGEGLIPKNRDAGKKHFVRKFDNLQASIRSYLNNLNRGHAYHYLREMRADMRRSKKPIIASELATGLARYSEKGQEYVREIQRMIRQNRLEEIKLP